MSNYLKYGIGKKILYEKSSNNFLEAYIINFNDDLAYKYKFVDIIYLEQGDQYKYEENINLSKIADLVPEVIFTLGRMNPPTPGHINGLIIPLLKYVGQKIHNTIINNYLQILDIVKSIDDIPDKQTIITNIQNKYQSINALVIDEVTLTVLQDFISQNTYVSNIYYKVYLTSTTNSSRLHRAKNNGKIMESLLQDISNPNADGERKFSSQNKKLLENPLILIEKTYFLYQMLIKKGIDNVNILNNICLSNIHENFCAVFGIKSAIRCALQIQLEISKGNYDSSKIIYLRGDDGENADNRIKFCLNDKINIDNILHQNDEPPSVNCETLPRISFEEEEISATRIRTPYLNYQNEVEGNNILHQIYNNYLEDNDLICLNSILANRLIFPNPTIQEIIKVIENQGISGKCDFIYRWGSENLEKRITRSQKKLIKLARGPGTDKITLAISDLFKQFDKEGKEIEIKKDEALQELKEMEKQKEAALQELKTKSSILEDDIIENKLQKQDEIDYKNRNKSINKSNGGGKKTKNGKKIYKNSKKTKKR